MSIREVFLTVNAGGAFPPTVLRCPADRKAAGIPALSKQLLERVYFGATILLRFAEYPLLHSKDLGFGVSPVDVFPFIGIFLHKLCVLLNSVHWLEFGISRPLQSGISLVETPTWQLHSADQPGHLAGDRVLPVSSFSVRRFALDEVGVRLRELCRINTTVFRAPCISSVAFLAAALAR